MPLPSDVPARSYTKHLDAREKRREQYRAEHGLQTAAELRAEQDPASDAEDAECLCVSLDTRYNERNASDELTPSTGIDTVHLFTDLFDVADCPNLTVTDTTNTETGETNSIPLYRPGDPDAPPVFGGRAYRNLQLAQVTIHSIDALSIQCSLPKLLRTNNVSEVSTPAELTLALAALERYLHKVGIRADLHSARITRLDIARTVELPRLTSAYEPALRSLTFPQTTRTRYEGTGYRWGNGSRQLCFYDKKLEQHGEESSTARLEYRLTRSQSVKGHAEIQTTQQLYEHMDDLTQTYQDAAEKLLSADTPTLSNEAASTEDGFTALLTALSDQRGATTTTLQALAVSRMTPDEQEALVKATHRVEGRVAAHRLRKKLDRLKGHAATLDNAAASEAALYRELCDALL